MAWTDPTPNSHAGRLRLRTVSDATAGASPWIMVKDYEVTVAAKPATGTVRVEATWSPAEVVQADNAYAQSNSIAKAWAAGDSAAANVDIFRRPTAIRFVATAVGAIGEIAG